MNVEPEMMRGGWGKVADRNGRCKNIDSVFVGLSRSELELSQLCNDDIQCDSLFRQYVGESVQLRYIWRSSA